MIKYEEHKIIGKHKIIFISEIDSKFTPNKTRIRIGIFKCHCGKEFNCSISHIKSGNTKSCGCQKYGKSTLEHGLSKHRTHKIWRDMLQRCNNKNNPSYKNYGSRGIIVCDEWKNDFKSFYDWAMKNGYEKGLTLDREDNDGSYEPDNCRWVTKDIQSRNRRKLEGCSSKYVGVSFDKISNKWFSYITISNKLKHIGRYKTDIEAAKARDNYILEKQLNGYKLNF